MPAIEPSLDNRIEALSPQVNVRPALEEGLQILRNYHDAPVSILVVSRMIEGRFGLTRQIAQAAEYKLEHKLLVYKIEELKAEKIIPPEIADNLHWIRLRSNWARHDDDDDQDKELKEKDAEFALRCALRVVEWFYSRFERGPHLQPIYTAGIPLLSDIESTKLFVGFKQPPAAPTIFDRAEELATLRKLLSDRRVRLLLLSGREGIGKTVLVSKACDDIASEKLWLSETSEATAIDQGVYVDCAATHRHWAETLYTLIGGLLGKPASDRVSEVWANNTRSLTDKLKFALSKLKDANYLLRFENIEGVLNADGSFQDEDFQAFLVWILSESHPNFRVIATSRLSPRSLRAYTGAYQEIALGGLPEEDAIAFLRSLDNTKSKTVQQAPVPVLQDIVQKTGGNPYLMEKIVGLLTERADLSIERFLQSSEIFDALLSEHYKSLSKDAQRVLDVLAIYDLPVDLDTISYIVKRFAPACDVARQLDHLIQHNVVTYNESDRTYELQPIDQQYAYSHIEAGNGYSRAFLHAAAASYFAGLLATYTEQGRDQTSYQKYYRFEQPYWQFITTEWLRHSALAPNRSYLLSHVLFAHIYFAAFWWWGDYIPFPFCDKIRERWGRSNTRPEDRQFLEILDRFDSAYPKKQDWKSRRYDLRWKEVKDVLQAIRGWLHCDEEVPSNGMDRRAVQAITAQYLAEALRFLGTISDDMEEPARLYRQAAENFAQLPDYSWSESYVLFGLAEMQMDNGALDDAFATCREALEKVEHPDHEAAAHIYRILGDICWKRRQLDLMWKAYRLAIWEVYCFQYEPHAPDHYTVTLYTEMTDRIVFRLKQQDESEAAEYATELHAFWNSYWRSLKRPEQNPSKLLLMQWISSDDPEPGLKAYLSPPTPRAGDQRYAQKAHSVATDMEKLPVMEEYKRALGLMP